MKIKYIRFRNIKNFSPTGVEFKSESPNLSLLTIPTKSELSTILDCIQAVLNEKDTAHNQLIYSLTNPSGYPPVIELGFIHNDNNYFIRKQFITETSTLLRSINYQRSKTGNDAQAWLLDNIISQTIRNDSTAIVWANQGALRENTATHRKKHQSLYTTIENDVLSLYNHSAESKLLIKTREERETNFKPNGRMKKQQEREILTDLEKVKTEIAQKKLQIEQFVKLTEERQQILNLKNKEKDDMTLNKIVEKNIARKVRVIKRDLKLAKQNLGRLEAVEQLHKKNLIFANDSKKYLKKLFDDAVKERDDALRYECRDIIQSMSEETLDNIEILESLKTGIKNLSKKLDENLVTESKLAELRSEFFKQDRLNLIASLKPIAIVSRLTDVGFSKIKINDKKPSLEQKTSTKTEINIEELGSFVIESIASNLEANSRKAQSKRITDLLVSLGVSSLEEAEDKLIMRREIEFNLHKLFTLLEYIAPDGGTDLQNRHDSVVQLSEDLLFNQLDNEGGRGYLDAVENLSYLQKRYESAMERICSDEKKHHEAIRNIKSLEAAIEVKQKELNAYEGFVDGKEDLTLKIKNLERIRDVNERLSLDIDPIYDKLDENTSFANELEDWVTKKANIHLLKSRLTEISRELEGFCEIEMREEIRKLEELQKSLENKFESNEIRFLALKHIESSLADNYTPLYRELLPLLKIVFPDAEISLNGDFNAEEFRRLALERVETVESLSGETLEQIAVLTRLAFAQLMAKRGREMPLILEEALVRFDNNRLENVFRVLRSASREIQCIVFTCHEKNFSTLGAKKLKLVPWLQNDQED